MLISPDTLVAEYNTYIKKSEDTDPLPIDALVGIVQANRLADVILDSHSLVPEGDVEAGNEWFQGIEDHIQELLTEVNVEEKGPRAVIPFVYFLFNSYSLMTSAPEGFVTPEQFDFFDLLTTEWYNKIQEA